MENNPPGPRRLPELLAPAGDWECAKAAVENGADAIYFGLEKFNARMRAHNFTEAALPKLMEFLHRRGVKGYVTFNTLVFANELGDAENYLRAIIAAGVDAAIVQDVGICRLIRRLSPDFPIHASTQMTVTSAAGVEFARNLGCNLVVLARECSIKEIEKIREGSAQCSVPSAQSEGVGPLSTDALGAGHSSPLPLEVFVHGALCVAYSGQCLTSESLGGRSANRGECAQACRMPYELISDGQPVPLGDRRYLLSPQDLAGLEVLPDLIRAGVSSLKIEGRLKSPEYVANITRVYRKALDECGTRNAERGTDAPRSPFPVPRYELEMAFSRGLYTGWFRGINNQELAHARFGKKRGVFLGEVSRIQGGRVALKLAAPLKPGDGVVFDAGRPDQDEEGGRVYTLEPRGGETFVGFGHGDLDFNRIHVGDKIWKTSDPELDRRLRQSFAGDAPHFTRPVDFEVHGCVGQPMTVIARDETGHVAQVASAMPLTTAEKQPLTTEKLRAQLGRLGGTPLHLGALNNSLAGEVMLPVSELNRLRREVVAQLEILRAQPKRWTLFERGTRSAECGALRRRFRVPRSAFRAHLAHLGNDLLQRQCLLRVHLQRLRREDLFERVGVAFGNFRRDGHEVFVLQLAHGLGRRAGQFEQPRQRKLAPLLDDVPDLHLALGELGQFTSEGRHADMQTLAPAFLLLADGIRQDALERDLRRAAIVIRDPARQPQHLGRDRTLRADDLENGAEIRVRRFLDERGDDARHLARAERNFHARSDLDAARQLRRDGVIELLAERNFEGDARDHWQGHLDLSAGVSRGKASTRPSPARRGGRMFASRQPDVSKGTGWRRSISLPRRKGAGVRVKSCGVRWATNTTTIKRPCH